MSQSANLKSKIFRIVSKSLKKDFAVQAYTQEEALSATAAKLEVEESDVRLGKMYPIEELKVFWQNPKKLFLRDYETSKKENVEQRKAREKAQADLNALLRHEDPKVLSDGNLYEMYKNSEGQDVMRHRAFYTGITNNSRYPRTGVDRPFYTDTNDLVLDHPDTVLVPNTDYIVPVKVNGSTNQEMLDSVFRFRSVNDAYENVRKQIIDAGIDNLPYRHNPSMTYLEACDSWQAGTGVSKGIQASKESIATFKDSIHKKKGKDGRLLYPKSKVSSNGWSNYGV